MGLFSKCLMKWHEPRTRARIVTAKSLLIAYGVIVLFSIVMGFIGGKFHLSNALPPFVWLSAVWLGFVLISRLHPGPLIQLRDDEIVRTESVSGRSSKLRYKEIDSIHFERSCTGLWNSKPDKSSGGQKLTNFDIRKKAEVIVDDAIESSEFPTIGGFTVPHNVDVEQVLRVLRDKGVRIIEQKPTTPS